MRRTFPQGFTIIELLVVISIIALLISILLPSLAGVREQARLVKWKAYADGMRKDPRGLIQYTFENQDGTERYKVNNKLMVRNQATLNPMKTAKTDVEPQDFNCFFTAAVVANEPKWVGTEGTVARSTRWKGKGGVEFFGNAKAGMLQTLDHENSLDAMTCIITGRSRTTTWNDTGFLISKRDVYIMHANGGGQSTTWYGNNGGWVAQNGISVSSVADWHVYGGTWEKLTVTPAPGTFRQACFQDGAQKASAVISGNPTLRLDTSYTAIGHDDSQSNRYLDGWIDEVFIGEDALNPDEIQNHGNVGAARTRS